MYLEMIETIQKNYFSGLQNQISKMVETKDFKIITFLYNIVFDNSYYQLTRVFQHSEFKLNNQIGKEILNSLSKIELNDTEQLIQVIPLFLLFLISQNLDINCCLNQDNQNEWEMFLIAVMKKCNYDTSAEEDFTKLKKKLEIKYKNVQSISLEDSVNLIVSSQKLLELLNYLFYQDYSIVAISSSQDPFFNFQLQKKLQIIINSYRFLQQRDKGIINSTIEDSKMKVAISFIEKNYNYDYLTDKFHNEQAGIIIFSLIQLDHKQFQNFFYSKRPSVQESLLNQIKDIVEISDNYFYNLLLVGKCLSKLRQWKYALDVYNKLQNQITNYQDKEKFRIYIYFKIYKIQFFQGQIKNLTKKLINLNNLIEQHQQKHIEFYQPNNREIYNQCLFITLLISVYTNSTDLRKSIMMKISPIILLSNQSTQKRYFNMLQYQFFRLAKQQEIIFKGDEGEKQLQFILNKTQSICQERQDIESKNSNFFASIKAIFHSANEKGKLLISIKSYYRAVEEFLIINILVRLREICILQYLNPNLYPLLRVFLAQNNFFTLNLKSQIYFFIHDFDEAYYFAQQTKNHKMIGQILEYWDRFEDAIEAYKKVNSPSSEINQAILLKIIYDQTSQSRNSLEKRQSSQYEKQNAIYYFNNLVQKQTQYKNIAQMYLGTLFRPSSLLQLSQIRREEAENRLKNPSITNYSQQELSNQSRFSEEGVSAQSQSFKMYKSESEQLIEFQYEDDYFQSHLNLNFPIRKDIKMFYNMLRDDLRLEQHYPIRTLLDEFIKKTHFLKYESRELFNNNYLGEKIGQGGNSEVYKFNFQDQCYAAKVISIEYMGSGDTMNHDKISDIENKLLEICIICDIAMSKTKYCIGIEHLGLIFENILGKSKIYQIIIITKIYDNYEKLSNWDEMDKIKYIYKLSLGLAALQIERNLLHLDLKPENVLVDSNNKNPVIADFGLSKYSQKSQNLSGRTQQITLKYTDPEFVDYSYQSRKNDVYSFGVALFYYFSGCIPYDGYYYYQILAKNKYFQEIHQAEIKNIQNDLIKVMILDCTKPIANRISFVLVIKRLFIYQYSITNPQVKQLIEILFDHIEYQQNERKMKTIYTYIKVMKSFIKYTNSFQTQKLENRVLQSYEILSSKTSNSSFKDIIQKMKQFINWSILNQHDFVLKLIDFQINCNSINQDKMQITFNFWVEDAQKILSTNMILQIPFYLVIAQILKQIHEYSVCLLQIPLEQIYLKDDKIKLNCFDYSQNLKIDQNKQYELDCLNVDPNIHQSMKFSYQNDVYALFVLIEQTMEFMRFKLDQDIQDKTYQFLQILKQNQVISLEEIIGKLLH